MVAIFDWINASQEIVVCFCD